MSEKVLRTVTCFVVIDSKILLLKRQNTWYENNKYMPPGGNIDPGEEPKLAAVREPYEETGIETPPDSLTLIKEYPNTAHGRQFYSYYYVTSKCSGNLENKEPDRHSGIGWFPLDNLPKNTSQVVYDTLKLL